MLVTRLLEQSAARLPHKTALVADGQRLSYAEIDALANRAANGMIASGVEPGDRVALFLDNSVEIVIAMFAALKANATCSIINPGTRADKLSFMLDSLAPRILITNADRLSTAAPAADGNRELAHIVVVSDNRSFDHVPSSVPSRSWRDIMSPQPTPRPPERRIDLDLAMIIYTSGSTGTPNGVMCTHRSMLAVTRSIADYLHNDENDVVLNVLQLAFGYGLYQLLVTFAVGGTLVLERGFAFPFRMLELMRREGVTGMAGVPTIFSLLLGLKDLRKHLPPSLRYVTNAGGGMPASRIVALRDAIMPAELFSMYGQTECQRISFLPPEEIDRRPASVGKAIPNTEVCVADEWGRCAPPGVVGELVVRGSHLMSGYWKAPEKTAQRFRASDILAEMGFGLPGETLLFTNDLFTMDEDGFLYFVSRTDDIIKCRGEKVAPREIENALYLYPGVQDAAAVGVPDTMLGQAIKVYVSPQNGAHLNESAIREHLKQCLEDVMLPTYIQILPELPKGPTGKLNKQALAHIDHATVVPA